MDAIRMQKLIAAGTLKGQPDETFGVQDMQTHGKPHPDRDRKMSGKLKEGERAAPPAIKHTRGKHPSQAQPDHGGY